MGLDGINYLVAVTQMKASEANDAACQSQSKPTTQKTTSFDTYAKTVADTSMQESTVRTQSTAQKKQRQSLIQSILTIITNTYGESLREKARDLRG